MLAPGIKSNPQLEQDRAGPWRKSTAIILQAGKDPKIKKLLEENKDTYSAGSHQDSDHEKREWSPDDEEDPDPSPGPSKEVKKAKRSSQKIYNKTGKSKAVPKSDVMAGVSDAEDEPIPNAPMGEGSETADARPRQSHGSNTELDEDEGTSDDATHETGETDSYFDSDATNPDVDGADFE